MKAWTLACVIEKAMPIAVSSGSEGWERMTAADLRKAEGDRKVRAHARFAGPFSVSRRCRKGCTARRLRKTIAAISQIALPKPSRSTAGATEMPAMAPPRGTPACRIEKIRLRCRAGAVRISIVLPAGLLGARPRPINRAPQNPSSAIG